MVRVYMQPSVKLKAIKYNKKLFEKKSLYFTVWLAFISYGAQCSAYGCKPIHVFVWM